MKVAVTGAAGFVGRHVVDSLKRRGDDVHCLDAEAGEAAWEAALGGVDAVLHLAGVNRPDDASDFRRFNVGLTERLVSLCLMGKQHPKILFSSSVHAAGNTAYGQSKREAEVVLQSWAAAGHGEAVLFRLNNIFGKWSRPDYNSVVATWCYRITRELSYEVTDPARVVTLAYIDDVIAAFIAELDVPLNIGMARYAEVLPIEIIELGALRDQLEAFRIARRTGMLPDLSDPFSRKLFATYLSFLPPGHFGYDLEQRTDARGVLAEFLKSEHCGQIFVSRTKPGVVRGNHFHHTKVEKFLVLEGDAVIRFRDLRSGAHDSYAVRGTDFRVVDIPPGWTHNIENVGTRELVVLFWSSEVFDPSHPDTYVAVVGSDDRLTVREE